MTRRSVIGILCEAPTADLCPAGQSRPRLDRSKAPHDEAGKGGRYASASLPGSVADPAAKVGKRSVSLRGRKTPSAALPQHHASLPN
jgi:hypothetical protein